MYKYYTYQGFECKLTPSLPPLCKRIQGSLEGMFFGEHSTLVSSSLFHLDLRSSLPLSLGCLGGVTSQQFSTHRVFGSRKTLKREKRGAKYLRTIPLSVFFPFIGFHPSVLVRFLEACWFDPLTVIPNCFFRRHRCGVGFLPFRNQFFTLYR